MIRKKFDGFNKDIFKFFAELENHNNFVWFNQNRERYKKILVEPSKSFVENIAPFVNRLNPSIRTEPKFNETIMRINKDIRFNKNEPYRNYWLIHFGRFKMDSEFFLYFDKESFDIGLFINKTNGKNLFFNYNLNNYKKEIINVFSKYSLNDKYDLYTLNKKGPERLIKKFNAENHFNYFEKHELLILQKSLSKKFLGNDKLILEMIRMISELYPLYCFCISPNPLKEIDNYDNEFGEIIS